MHRPRKIRRFAALALSALICNVASTLLTFGLAGNAWLGCIFGAAITGALVLWVLVGRSLVGRLFATIWIAFHIGANLAAYAWLLSTHSQTGMGPAAHVFNIAASLIDGVGLFYLWSRGSTDWLQAGGRGRPTGS
jgi:hypothetical protein